MTKPGKADKWAARSERLSAALRENLKRRKAQARQREEVRQQGQGEETSAPDAGLKAQGPDFGRNRGRY